MILRISHPHTKDLCGKDLYMLILSVDTWISPVYKMLKNELNPQKKADTISLIGCEFM